MKKALMILILLLCACTVNNETPNITVLNETNTTIIVNDTTPAIVNETGPKVCTQEAKLCPDGTAVGRTGPNCEFAECPKIDAIIAIGDSLTYGEGLADRNDSWISLYAKQIKLYNYAVTGATSFSARYYQLELLKNASIEGDKLIFLWIGANDAANLVTLQDFEANYREIVKYIVLNMKNTNLVLMNIPDASKLSIADLAQSGVDDLLTKYGVQTNVKVKTLTREVLMQYNQIIMSIARQNSLKIIDMFNYFNTFDNSTISADMFHPNEEGHRLIAQHVREELNR